MSPLRQSFQKVNPLLFQLILTFYLKKNDRKLMLHAKFFNGFNGNNSHKQLKLKKLAAPSEDRTHDLQITLYFRL
jgi:hypothetical protein